MTKRFAITLLAICAVSVSAQRPPYAGQRPVGYYDPPKNTVPSTATSVVPLADRFGGPAAPSAGAAPPPPQRLPTAALGDAVLVDQLNQRPIEQRPFWLINYEAIEAQKNSGRPTTTSSVASQTSTPILQNRFADDEPSIGRPLVNTHYSALGSASDPGNFLLSRPEIVYPLVQSQPTVITLNGQQYLLTPLLPASDGLVGAQQQLQRPLQSSDFLLY